MGLYDVLSAEFSKAQSVVMNAAANANSTNVMDLSDGKTLKDHLGNTIYNDLGDLPCRILVWVGTALDAAVTGAILSIKMYSHSAAASIEGGTQIGATVSTTSIDDAAANFPAKTVLMDVIVPANTIDGRYFGLDYSVATQNIVAGTVHALLFPAGGIEYNDANKM